MLNMFMSLPNNYLLDQTRKVNNFRLMQLTRKGKRKVVVGVKVHVRRTV